MNFYYDPILGLQYNYIPLFMIDIESIPIDIKFNIKERINCFDQIGVFPIKSSKSPSIQIIGNITNYIL